MNESRKTRRNANQERALTVLRQARELLVQRLSEAVLEVEDEILDDARGDSYGGEIDSLHERLGIRLNQVNVLLAGLATEEESDSSDDKRRQIGRKVYRTDPPESSEPHDVTTARGRNLQPNADTNIPATQTSVDAGTTIRIPSSTYPLFVQDIVRRDLPAAGRRLADVLGTSPSVGEAYSSRFRDQLDRDPGFLAKVHSLRKALQGDRDEEARQLLSECFGFDEPECTAAMQALKGWL